MIRYAVESDEDSAPHNISDTEDWLNRNGDQDNLNNTKDDCVLDIESGIEQGIGIADLECPEQKDVSTAPNVSGLIQPIWNSK
jgi:hypothetical protein